ncbi:MAG: hypothetical protein JST15_07900 [Bacteroidetes bacterium]|nr:hypothetical protein [Bacteroidota bacterium]
MKEFISVPVTDFVSRLHILHALGPLFMASVTALFRVIFLSGFGDVNCLRDKF